jgi:hypothetical protein
MGPMVTSVSACVFGAWSISRPMDRTSRTCHRRELDGEVLDASSSACVCVSAPHMVISSQGWRRAWVVLREAIKSGVSGDRTSSCEQGASFALV